MIWVTTLCPNCSSTSRRTIDIRRGSGIPQPSVKGRRSSSETRDGRMSALQQPAVRRSRSQVNVYQGASAVTPMRGLVVPSLPGSSQSLRCLQVTFFCEYNFYLLSLILSGTFCQN